MPKVDYCDLEALSKFLDNIPDPTRISIKEFNKINNKAKKLSKMIKDKYTEIKPGYDRID